ARECAVVAAPLDERGEEPERDEREPRQVAALPGREQRLARLLPRLARGRLPGRLARRLSPSARRTAGGGHPTVLRRPRGDSYTSTTTGRISGRRRELFHTSSAIASCRWDCTSLCSSMPSRERSSS